MNQKNYLSFLFLIFFLNISNAQTCKYLKNTTEISSFSDKTTRLLKEGKMNECFTEVKQYWPMPENEIDELQTKTVKFFNLISLRFGEIEGYKKIKEQKLSDFAFKEIYVLKYKYTALRVTYIYYKNNEGWLLNNFSWDDKYYEEF